MSFKDYSLTPSANTTLGDGTYIGPNMSRNKARPAFQQLAADGKELADQIANVVQDAEEAVETAIAGHVFTVTSAPGQTVADRALLAAISTPANGQPAILTEAGREGIFKFSTANLSAQVTADPGQGVYVAPSTATSGASGAWVRVRNPGEFRATWYGVTANGTTDDTTALQRAINAVCAQGGRLVLPAGVINYTKVTIPALGPNPSTGLIGVEIVGSGPPSSWFGTLPLAGFTMGTVGTVLKSSSTGGAMLTVSATSNGGYNFSWYHLVLRDLLFRSYDNPNISAIDAAWAQQLTMDNVMIDTGVWPTNGSQPTHNTAYGVITPAKDNGAFTHLKDVVVAGYYYGYKVNEHTFLNYCQANCCLYGAQFVTANHASYANRFCIQRCQTGLTFDGLHAFNCDHLDVEHAGASSTSGPDNWQIPVRDVADLVNYAHGYINWWVVEGNVGVSTTFTWTGGANLVINRLGRNNPSLSIFSAATQSIPNNVATAVTLANYATESAATKSGDPTKIVIAETGTYSAEFSGAFAANATGYRQIQILSGAAGSPQAIRTEREEAPNGTRNTIMNLYRASFSATAGDEVIVQAFQNSGGALNLILANDAGSLVLTKLRSSVP